jgi:hypothetical protein
MPQPRGQTGGSRHSPRVAWCRRRRRPVSK